MSNIKIAVLDTGIDRVLYDEFFKQGRVSGCKSFWYDYYYKKIISDDRVDDFNGHGSKSISLINRVCPETDFYIVKMLGISGVTNEAVLESALDYVSNLDVDIIVSSSSLNGNKKYDNLEKICNEIQRKGKILIFSVENGKETSIPAKYESVIGVIGGNIDENCFWNDKKEIQMQCSSKTVISRSLYGRRSTYTGNSKATSLAAGLIAKIMFEKNIFGSEVIEYLNKNYYSKKFDFKPFTIQTDGINKIKFDYKKEKYLVENDKDYHRFLYALCEFFKNNSPDYIRSAYLINENKGQLWYDIEEFFRYISFVFDIEIDTDDLECLQYPYLFFENVIKKLNQKE